LQTSSFLWGKACSNYFNLRSKNRRKPQVTSLRHQLAICFVEFYFKNSGILGSAVLGGDLSDA